MYDICDRCRQEIPPESDQPIVVCMNCGWENTRTLRPSETAVVGPSEVAMLQPAVETAVLPRPLTRRRKK
jgi:hypothetical protein